MFGSMRKRQMADVVTQGSHPQYSSSVGNLVITIWEDIHDSMISIRWRSNDLIDSLSEFHHTQRMLKPFMSCTRVN